MPIKITDTIHNDIHFIGLFVFLVNSFNNIKKPATQVTTPNNIENVLKIPMEIAGVKFLKLIDFLFSKYTINAIPNIGMYQLNIARE